MQWALVLGLGAEGCKFAFSLLTDYRAVSKHSRGRSRGTGRRWEHRSLTALHCHLTKPPLTVLQWQKMEMTEPNLTYPCPHFYLGLRPPNGGEEEQR